MKRKLEYTPNYWNWTLISFSYLINEIETYHKSVRQEHWIEFVLPEALKTMDLSKIDLILVWDNPWSAEFELQEFLSERWQAWKMARWFFKKAISDDAFESKILILNKTFFHTRRTADLKEFNLEDEISKSQILIAKLIGHILERKKVPVIVIWNSEMDWIFKRFFNTLAEEATRTWTYDSISIIPHFSMSHTFRKQKDDNWNRLIDSFLEKHENLKTVKWNISSKALLSQTSNSAAREYFLSVIMKQTLWRYEEIFKDKK